MSTYQPPGGQPPEGTPSYAPPQDPWASGQDHGLASVPTDPIPQQYDPYAHGVGGDVWAQETVAHGEQQYGYGPPQPQRSKAGLIAVVFFAVLVLGGGGGFVAWYVTTKQNNADPSPSGSSRASSAPSTVSTTGTFDPHTLSVGDCIVNKGTLIKPIIFKSACTATKSFKVIKKLEGASIVENAKGLFDAETTSVAACAGTGFQSWYGYKDVADDKKDAFFCLLNNN
jgi:hypothetical protein